MTFVFGSAWQWSVLLYPQCYAFPATLFEKLLSGRTDSVKEKRGETWWWNEDWWIIVWQAWKLIVYVYFYWKGSLPMIPSCLHLSSCPLHTSTKRKEYHCHLWDCQARLVIADLMLAICCQCGAWEEAPGDFSEGNFFHKWQIITLFNNAQRTNCGLAVSFPLCPQKIKNLI